LELEGRAANRHLLFLHRLEERRLHLGRRAVDLVGENDVGEDRSLLDAELARRLIVHLRPDDVSGEKVWRELNAIERRVDRFGERADGERLGESGNTLEEHVTTGEEADEQP